MKATKAIDKKSCFVMACFGLSLLSLDTFTKLYDFLFQSESKSTIS
ncbi:MAG: hypothetical protein P1U46_00710 [Patescibacteria group bacterium]|nr:hypothetical protein [Patescibacteria group bacterium]